MRNEPTEQGTSDRSKESDQDPKEETQNMHCPVPIASSVLTDNHQPLVEITNAHTGTNPEPVEDSGPPTTHSTDGLTLVKENGDVASNTEMMIEDSGVSSFPQAVLLDLNSAAAGDEQDETHHGSCDVETRGAATAVQGKADSQNSLVGSGESNSIALKDPHKSADSYNGEALVGVHGSGSANNTPEPVKPSSTSPIDEPSLVCLYRCCSQCVSILKDSMHKLVTRELRLGKSDITADGVHDAVSLLSVEIIAAVRKSISSKNKGATTEEASVEEYQGKESCSCNSLPGNFLESVECCSHSAEEQGNLDKANTYPSPKTWLEPVFVFRDGILVPVSTTEDDRVLHCKYDSFCLASLIQLIATEMK